MNRIAAVAALVVAAAASSAWAQVTTTPPPIPQSTLQTGMGFETRAQLTARIQLLESQRKTSEAAALRRRLDQGDFPEGSRIGVAIEGSTDVARTDTLIVRAGGVVNLLPSYGQVSLRGVLRSEAADAIRKQIRVYLVSANVRVSPLVRLSVTGSVQLPRISYYMPPDIQIGDALNIAGGVGQAVKPKIVVLRGQLELWKPDDVRDAIRAGRTLEQMGLEDGDEIFVETKTKINWLGISQMAIGITNLIFAVVRVSGN